MKLEKDDKTVIFFLFLVVLGIAISIVFILPVLRSKALSVIYLGIHVFLLITFSFGALLDPGNVKKFEQYDFQHLLNTLDPIYLCPEGSVIRTPRSRHCNLGNRCIDRYDHHCPYVNNGVGYRNHAWFTLFLISISILLIFQITITALAFKKDPSDNAWSFMDGKGSEIGFLVAAIVILAVGSIFLLPVLVLTFTHLTNFCKNMTTHERFSSNAHEEISLLSSYNTSSKKSSLVKSITEILVQDETAIRSFNYVPNPRLRESYVGTKDKRGGSCRNICKMIAYKQPDQPKTKRIIERAMAAG